MKHPNRKLMASLIEYERRYSRLGNCTSCLIVKGDRVLARAFTTVERARDPTMHAEMKAISAACRKIKDCHLNGCWLYTTQEPCPMCAGAIVWARVRGVVYGWRGRRSWKTLDIKPEAIFRTSPRKIKVYPAFMEKECVEVRKFLLKKWNEKHR